MPLELFPEDKVVFCWGGDPIEVLNESDIEWLKSALIEDDCKLETVDLTRGGLTDDMVKILAEALKVNLSVRTLVLDSNSRITAAGLGYLAEALEFNFTLHRLSLKSLQHNGFLQKEGVPPWPIHRDFMKFTTVLSNNNRGLLQLDLVGNDFDEAGVGLGALINARQVNPRLETVSLSQGYQKHFDRGISSAPKEYSAELAYKRGRREEELICKRWRLEKERAYKSVSSRMAGSDVKFSDEDMEAILRDIELQLLFLQNQSIKKLTLWTKRFTKTPMRYLLTDFSFYFDREVSDTFQNFAKLLLVKLSRASCVHSVTIDPSEVFKGTPTLSLIEFLTKKREASADHMKKEIECIINSINFLLDQLEKAKNFSSSDKKELDMFAGYVIGLATKIRCCYSECSSDDKVKVFSESVLQDLNTLEARLRALTYAGGDLVYQSKPFEDVLRAAKTPAFFGSANPGDGPAAAALADSSGPAAAAASLRPGAQS